MKVKIFFSALLLSLLAIACNTLAPTRNTALEKRLVGPWQSGSLKLTMNTFGNKDTTRVFEVDETTWQAKMGMRPIHTIYFGDGTFISEHRNLKDSVIFSPAGVWNIMGDTLMVKDTFPEVGLPYKYKIVINEKIAELTGIEDCDNDGTADDDYYGTIRRQKR